MELQEIRLFIWEDEEWATRVQTIAQQAGFPDVRLAREADGKPFLQNAGGFHFNVSTTRGRTLGAFASVEVGVDWEHTARNASAAAIARRYFSESEVRWMEGAGPSAVRLRFFQLWTAKEAGVKLDGCGLYTGGLCNCRIDVGSCGEHGRLVRGVLNRREFQLQSLLLPGGFWATVAAYEDFRLALPPDFPKVMGS